MAGQASATPVECPSVTVTRVPAPAAGAHRAAPVKPRRQAALYRPAVKRTRNTTVAALRTGRSHGPRPAAAPNLARPMPVLAPILPPDTLPATEPVLAAEAAPAATPIVGYRLQRSVKMVACEPARIATPSRDVVAQLAGPPGGPGLNPSAAPLFGIPPTQSLLVSTPPGTPPVGGGPGGGTNPGTGPGTGPDVPGVPVVPVIPVKPDQPPGGGTGGPPTLSPVPEPATWAMLIVGFFGLGARLRSSGRRVRGANVAPVQHG